MRKNELLTQVDQTLTMRAAGPGDEAALAHLAALDSQDAPRGDVLVAEVGGELRAAVAVDSGSTIADPFRPTADVVTLLRERASQVNGRSHGFGLRLARAA